MEFQLQKLQAELTQVEADLATIRKIKKNPLYEDLKPQFDEITKKLFYKKRRLNLKFNKVYANYLEWADFLASVDYE